jgi:SAM-dependent methyltransferase
MTDTDARRVAPATARNRAPILAVLETILPSSGSVLEVASGSGEHIVHFAAAFPALSWQPSDPDPAARASIAAWAEASGLANIRPPLPLDAAGPRWPIEQADAILAINMIHISPWAATIGLFAQAARLLGPGAPLYLYGPYLRAGHPTAPSNLAFDADLRARDPAWGLRDLDTVSAVAEGAGFTREAIIEMPANNLSLIFRRR